MRKLYIENGGACWVDKEGDHIYHGATETDLCIRIQALETERDTLVAAVAKMKEARELSAVASATLRFDNLVDLAHHLRYCRECGETDVMNCDQGKPLWLACFPEPTASQTEVAP